MYLWELTSYDTKERICSESIALLKIHIEKNYTPLGGEIVYDSDDGMPMNVCIRATRGRVGGLEHIGVIRKIKKI